MNSNINFVSRIYNGSSSGQVIFQKYCCDVDEELKDRGKMKVIVTRTSAKEIEQHLKPLARHVRCDSATSVNIRDFIDPSIREPTPKFKRCDNFDIRRWR